MKMNHLGITGAVLVLAGVALSGGCTHTGTEYGRSTGEKIDDRTIASRVKSALKADSLLAASEVNVASYRGDVVLTGFVDHTVQRERASDITRNVPGVHWFQNQILVKGESPYAKMAASVTNSSEEAAAPAVWERGTLDYYGKPPPGTSTSAGSEQK